MLSVPEEISLCCDFFVFVVDVVQRPLFLVGGKSSPMVSGEQALLLDLASLSPHDMVSSFLFAPLWIGLIKSLIYSWVLLMKSC